MSASPNPTARMRNPIPIQPLTARIARSSLAPFLHRQLPSRLPYSMREQNCARSYADRIPCQIAHAEDVAGRPLVVDFSPHAQAERDSDRATQCRPMMQVHCLQRAIRHAFDESRHEEVLYLVDSEPGIGVTLRGSRLSVNDVDCQTARAKLIPFARLRADFEPARSLSAALVFPLPSSPSPIPAS